MLSDVTFHNYRLPLALWPILAANPTRRSSSRVPIMKSFSGSTPMKPESPARPRKRRHYMMAMVLGTALSAFGQSAAQAAPTEAIQDISRYCTACWRNARLPADRWGDCTQEVFRRLLDRVPTEDWNRLLNGEGEERREFLRAIDAVKKRTQRDS